MSESSNGLKVNLLNELLDAENKKKSKKAIHNKNIRELRKKGLLPNFDGTYTKPKQEHKQESKELNL